ncbi:MAG: Hpt domain-containing protein, partial [Chloroflexi bacterium]|nr:Hpt domain-containing protein [Chloroflexota bacterium]
MSNDSRSAELEEIWSLFAQESRENLLLAEESLLKLEQDPGDASQVAPLFRAIHSFKGGARMMGLSNVESLAHHAEDLIALVRDEGVELQQPMIDVLLAVLDRLRAMLDQVLSTGGDVAAGQSDELIQSLSALISASAVGARTASPTATPAASIAQTTPDAAHFEPKPSASVESEAASPQIAPDETGPIAMTEPAPATLDNTPAAPSPEPLPAPSLDTWGEDGLEPAQAPATVARMDFVGFLQMAEGELGSLHTALDALAAGTEGARDQIHDLAARLAHAADDLGYERLSMVLQDLDIEIQRELPSDAPAPDAEGRLVLFKKLELAIFEELTRVQESQAGQQPEGGPVNEDEWSNIAWLFRHWNAERVFTDLARLTGIADRLDELERQLTTDGSSSNQIERLADEAAVHLRAIHHSCIFYHLDPAVHLTLSLQDLYGRVAQGELLANAALTNLTRTYVTNLGSGLDAIRDGENPELEPLTELIKQAQNFLYLSTDGPTYEVTRSILDVLDLPPSFKEVMTPETLAQFSQALQAGESFYTMLADLERDDAPSQLFFEWSHSPGVHLVTNVTVYRYQRTLFNFLLSTSLTHEAIVDSLAKMDPEWQ